MIKSRLYYDIKEQGQGTLKFYYYTAQIDYQSADLKSFINTINHDEVLYTADNVGFQNLLYDINRVEFIEFLLELNKLKDHIENLSRTDPQTANFEVAKLWGPNELQRKFQEWFEVNGFEMPMMN